jgi:hypothetical protein
VLDGAVAIAVIPPPLGRGGLGLGGVSEVLEHEHDALAGGASLAHERTQVAGPGLHILPRCHALEGED